MNLSTVKWAQWDKTQSRELLGLFICVCRTHNHQWYVRLTMSIPKWQPQHIHWQHKPPFYSSVPKLWWLWASMTDEMCYTPTTRDMECIYKTGCLLVRWRLDGHSLDLPANMSHNTTTPHNRFTAFFPGPPGWAGARRELLDFMVQAKINAGRHTDHLAGCHSIRTKQCPPPPFPHFLQAGCPSYRPTNSVKAVKATSAFRLGRRRYSSLNGVTCTFSILCHTILLKTFPFIP